MKSIKKFINNPIFIRVFTVALNFIANVLINRSLGISMKGQLTRIQNYANFFQLCFNLGICYAYPALVKKYGEIKSKQHTVTVIWLQTGLCIAASFAFLLFNPTAENVASAFLFIALLCNGQIVFVSLIDDIMGRNLLLFGSTLAYILFNVVAIIFAPGNVYVIVGILCAKYLFEVIICCFRYRYFSFVDPRNLDKEIIKTILKIGIPTAIISVLISCNYNIAIFLLDWMDCDDVQVGIFGVAYSLSNMMWFIPDAFKEMVYNRTAREENYRFVLRYIFLNMLLCFVICIGFIILGKWFLGFVYGEDYVVAYRVCVTLFIGIIPMVAFKLIHPIYINNGKVKPVALLLTIAVVVNLILGIILIPTNGAFGAALACVGSYCVCGALFFGKFYLDYCRKQ